MTLRIWNTSRAAAFEPRRERRRTQKSGELIISLRKAAERGVADGDSGDW